MKIQRLLIVPRVREISTIGTRATWSVAAVHDVPAPAQGSSEHASTLWLSCTTIGSMGMSFGTNRTPKLLTTRACLIPFLWFLESLLWRQASCRRSRPARPSLFGLPKYTRTQNDGSRD